MKKKIMTYSKNHQVPSRQSREAETADLVKADEIVLGSKYQEMRGSMANMVAGWDLQRDIDLQAGIGDLAFDKSRLVIRPADRNRHMHCYTGLPHRAGE